MLTAGTRIGPYEVIGPLGAGGMGLVYRARDPRLKRDIAIKVLPDDVATSPERLARFEGHAGGCSDEELLESGLKVSVFQRTQLPDVVVRRGLYGRTS